MNDNLEKKPKRIGAFKEFKIFMTEYGQVIMGKKKDLLISLMFPVLAAAILFWISGDNLFVHYDGTKS